MMDIIAMEWIGIGISVIEVIIIPLYINFRKKAKLIRNVEARQYDLGI